MSGSTFTAQLVGRQEETRRLLGLLDHAGERGAALVVRGEPGIGKSVLVSEARRAADARGMRTLAAAGVESEARLPFAGLHQLLRPVLGRAGVLPGPQRDAVFSAFGMVEPTAPDLFLIALAALNLLSEVATRRPLLIVVEDAHWLDRSSADVLSFVARRLESEPIVVVVAIRDGYSSVLNSAGLAELRLERLDDVAAAMLLASRAPDLQLSARTRLLAAAAGNPLALVELPVGLGERVVPAATPGVVPLTAHLEQAFSDRVATLPAAARALLLVGAANDGAAAAETLTAAGIVRDGVVTADDLAPAAAAGLAEIVAGELRFRHPLVRSAVYQGASVLRRQGAHAALAQVLDGDDRGIWHRAAAGSGPDDVVAAQLEAAAGRAVRRGAVESAVAALAQAAERSGDPARRAGRLLEAAELAAELGRRDTVADLMRQVEPLELSLVQRARVAWIRDVFDDGIGDLTDGTGALAALADRVTADGHPDLGLRLLWSAALRCFFADPGPQVRNEVVAAAERVSTDPYDARLLAILGFTAPVERGAVILERLGRAVADAADDPLTTRMLGNAAMAVGQFDVAIAVQGRVIAGLRAQGRLGLLARALSNQAWSAVHLGDLGVAVPAGEEAGRLAEETSQPNLHTMLSAHEAVVAALRGDHHRAEFAAADAERAALPLGAHSVLALVQFARGLSALAEGRYADAYAQLRRMHDPADPAFHHAFRCFAVGELVEAAVHSGQRDPVAGLVAELEEVGRLTPSTSLHIGLRLARALLADDADAEACFEAALHADLSRWPLPRARLQLAYGVWLRRQRRVADSRAPLRTARETFDALGVLPWSERARQELRASGETSRRRAPEALDELTPQELQIAQFAAAGLTNREIGQRLYLSHRTVSSHLHRIFPKLGVTSRTALGESVRRGDPSG